VLFRRGAEDLESLVGMIPGGFEREGSGQMASKERLLHAEWRVPGGRGR
jgi:hypothetical protein